jgi:spore germination cell wall hydrolase CwlJ-like protein
MAYGGERSRSRQPTLLFRLLLTGIFVAISTTDMARPETGGAADVTALADALPRPTLPRLYFVTRALKADSLAADRLASRATSAALGQLGPAGAGGDDAAAATPVVFFASPDSFEDLNAPFKALDANTDGQSTLSPFLPNVDADHAWVNNPIPVTASSDSEIRCLAQAIYFEARGEDQRGQIAVAQVVINRLKNPAFPKTICGVVYQDMSAAGGCQFSFACDGTRRWISDQASWKVAAAIARKVVNDGPDAFLPGVGAATSYHATYVRPRWADRMQMTEQIGRHIFYETPGGGS